MQHLDHERLAALDHDPPTAAELTHLSSCAECRVERDAYVSLAQLASTAGDAPSANDDARLTDWSRLSAQLRSEGLLRTTGEHAVDVDNTPLVVRSLRGVDVSSPHLTPASIPTVVEKRTHRVAPFLRIAAALLLVLGGAALGRLSTGAPIVSDAFAVGGTQNATPGVLTGETGFASVEEATRVLTGAQRDYERASLWLASNDTTVRSSDVYRARLAALDQMMAASRAALRDAPQDPVLNHYYLAAYTAREATLQQLISTLPVDKTIEGF
jgi:hypothetical protein